MNIKKYINEIAILLSPPTTFFVGLTVMNFYEYHDVAYQTSEGERVYSKADGIASHTQVTIGKDGSVEVSRFNFWGEDRFLTDENGDQAVDRIFKTGSFARGSHDVALYRDRDFGTYPKDFESADRDFRKQIRRFKPLMTNK